MTRGTRQRDVAGGESPHTKKYVDNEAGQRLSVLEVTAPTVERTIDRGLRPAVAALAPDLL